MEWRNGPIAKVVVAKGTVWCVSMQNAEGNTLICEGGEREESYTYCGNKTKSLREGKRLGREHGVPVYHRDQTKGHILIQKA